MKFELSYIEDFRISDSKKLICRSSNGSMTVSFLERDMLFVEFDFDQLWTPQSLEKASSILKGSPSESQSEVTASSDENAITATSGNLQINISRINGNLKVRRNGITVFGGNLGNKDTVIPHTQVRAFRNSTDQRWFARINEPLNEDDRFFGLGDKSGVPDRRGKRVRMFSRDSLGYDAKTSDPLYKSIPFFIKQNPVSGAICGFFYPEAQINAIDLGEESPFYSFVEIENGPIGFYIIPGDDYGQIMRSYCTVTGFPTLPPLFSFGFFGSSMNYVESDDAMNRITHYFDQTEENKIPCEGMYVSSGYLKADDGKRYAFFWNKRKFPD
ncbi:MAG: glycoside hydrolase family 31 protein, partial [Sphaerochaetaceae bacterium]|nr:glycoside hydrolase family 31 protein [Sphaerochaetaceae bacterium]